MREAEVQASAPNKQQNPPDIGRNDWVGTSLDVDTELEGARRLLSSVSTWSLAELEASMNGRYDAFTDRTTPVLWPELSIHSTY